MCVLASSVSAVLLLTSAADALPRRASGPALPFQRMTFGDAEKAGAVGAGCTWLDGRGRESRILSMADDRAAVKRGGRLVMLKPAPRARDLAPFTFDRWTGAGILIAVRQTGRARSAGTASDAPADLVVTIAGRTRTYAGRLNCGT